jgi:hypothetical protein
MPGVWCVPLGFGPRLYDVCMFGEAKRCLAPDYASSSRYDLCIPQRLFTPLTRPYLFGNNETAALSKSITTRSEAPLRSALGVKIPATAAMGDKLVP